MQKAIIILDGISDGKTKFQEIAKQNNIWTWQINASNVLSVASRSMGWSGVKDDRYYEFLNKLMALVNEYWDFKIEYFNTMIQKFKIHDKAQLLIIHGAGEAESALKENEEQEFYFVNIVRDEKSASEAYDMTLIFNDTFEDQAIKLLDVLLGSKGE
jgi:hypothetical protein